MATSYHDEKGALQPAANGPPPSTATAKFAKVDFVLRLVLFATTLVAVIVMATANQTKLIPVSLSPPIFLTAKSKFHYSPAFIYFVAALSVACLYSIITAVVSFLSVRKPGGSSTKLLFHFVIFDTLLLGIVAAATGTAGGVAYVGLRGNSHSRWNKICNNFDTFCQHLGGAVAVSIVAGVVLSSLILLSVYSLSKRIPK